MTDKQRYQVELYGRLLTGEETELEMAKLARTQYLKGKMRPRLAAAIGDYGDNLSDVTRALVLSDAIRLGIEIDAAVVAAYASYVEAMYLSYGGGAAIMAVLAGNTSGLQAELVSGYYVAKQAIAAAETVEAVQAVDLPGEPTHAE
jgi:hypothetical protein